MSETSSVTRCPNCKTAFHIGTAQLDAAGGKVRCGSCLEIFDAKEHFVIEQTHMFDGTSQESATEVELEENLEDEGPIILGDYDPNAAPSISREQVQQSLGDDDIPSLVLDAELDDEGKQALIKDVLDTVEALEKLDALEELESLDTSNPIDDLEEEQENENKEEEGQTTDQDPNDDQRQQWDVGAFDDELSSQPSQDNVAESFEDSPEDNLEDEKMDTTVVEDDLDEEPEDDALIAERLDDLEDEELDSDDVALSSEYFIDPDSARYRSQQDSHWGWKLAAASLLVAIAGQLLFWQPEMLREHAWFRSASETLCNALPCEPKPYLDINRIDVAGFIEPKLDLDNALTAYIELRNRAEIEQGFPNIEIRFVDVRGRVLRSRILTPKMYLRGEARSMERIPVNRSVQITVDFVDPGEQLRSYEIGLVP